MRSFFAKDMPLELSSKRCSRSLRLRFLLNTVLYLCLSKKKRRLPFKVT